MRGRRSNQAGAREYLSRLAEPVLPGERALAARPVRMGWSREVAVPREEIVPWRETPSWQLRQESGIESRMAAAPQGEDDAQHSSIETSAARLATGNEQRESQAARAPLPAQYHTAHMQAGLRTQEKASSREEKQSVEPLPRTLLQEEGYAEKSDRASRRHAEGESSPQIASVPRNESLAIRAEGSRIGNLSSSEGKQLETEANAAGLETPRDRIQDRIQDRVSIQTPREEHSADASFSNRRDASKDQNSGANRNNRESGTRVRIGTVEVRTVLRQQAPAPTPAVVPQPLPSRPSSSNAGPLTRGLGWRFGLVQG
jgi:hypothetical protein